MDHLTFQEPKLMYRFVYDDRLFELTDLDGLSLHSLRYASPENPRLPYQMCWEVFPGSSRGARRAELKKSAITKALKYSSTVTRAKVKRCAPVCAMSGEHELIFLHDKKNGDYLCWCLEDGCGCYFNTEQFELAVAEAQIADTAFRAFQAQHRKSEKSDTLKHPTINGPDGKCYYCDAKPCLCRLLGVLD